MAEIFKFVMNGIISLIISTLLLITGIIFLPDSWIITIIGKLKPKIISDIKKPYYNLIKIFTNLYINKELIEFDDDAEKFSSSTQYYLTQNEHIEKNIYVIDLCKDMISMLGYVLPSTVGGSGYDIYEQSLEYLYHYSNIVEPLDQDKNFYENFQNKVNDMRKFYYSTEKETDEGVKKTSMEMRDYFIVPIFDYLNHEKEKLDNLYSENKKKLVSLIKDRTHAV